MADKTEIAGVKDARGQKTHAQLNAGQRSTGEGLNVPLNVIIGEREGPRLGLVFCQHGNEWITLEGWYELFQRLNPSEVAGEVVALPAANPVAFEQKSRNSWFDALGGTHGNLNRAWPGQEDGWLSERLAYAISHNVLDRCDCVIDLHDGSPGHLEIYYGYLPEQTEGTFGQTQSKLGRGFGLDILVSKSLPYSGTLTQYLQTKQIPHVGVEIGQFYGFDGTTHRTPAEVTATGIENIMKILGMLDGVPRLPAVQIIVSPETRVKAQHGGLLRSHVTAKDIGKTFSHNDPLFEIIDIATQTSVETVCGPYEANILLSSPSHVSVVNPGDQGCHVADASTLTRIENSGA